VSQDPSTNVDRSLLDDVLAVVHRLGASVRLQDALELIAEAVVGVLGFGAAAINVATPEGDLRTEAVRGPAGIEQLLGSRRPLSFWQQLLAEAEPWGALRFYSHERDQSLVDQFLTWTPPGLPGPEPDAWHPDDALLAPLWDGDRLVGVVSVDEPRSGRLPGAAQRSVLEAFASQAAKAIRDTQAYQAAEALRLDVEHRWRLAFEQSPTGVILVGADGGFLELNDAFADMLGYQREHLVTLGFADVTHPDDIDRDRELFRRMLAGELDSYEVENRYLRADGDVVCGLVHVGVIRGENGGLQTALAQISDITERTRARDRLSYERSHDLVTGLPSRTVLGEKLAGQLAADLPTGVLFCDIDRFKTINDSLGRSAGDELLRAVAGRLRALTPPEFLLSRVAGDQFIVVAPGVDDRAVLRALADRLIAALSQPLAVGDLQVRLGMSVGVTVSSPRHHHLDELLSDAEEALSRAKHRGRGMVEVYDPEQDHPFTMEDLQLEQALRAAVDTGDGLQLYLQPIVSLDDESVVGAEALVRWRHPERGLLQPAQFLPLAEHTGLIVPLGWRILDLAVRSAALSSLGTPGWIAVNIAAGQLGRGLLPAAVRRALATYRVAPQSLHLEITETALVDASAAAIQELRDVAAMGVSIALDDFGTGYSSLSLLRDLPITVVKIDRSFIAPIAEDRRAAALVRSVVAMCHALGISTVAEGVETREQQALVSALGCDHAQGYLFGVPAALAVG
jgi:PAS domain S-box-containing protein/diguanylate cyclase (GGDEF)-like protein